MAPILAIAALLLSATPLAVRASPCLAMDTNFNLLIFGLGGKDYNAGTQDSWTGKSAATDITASGRPPFDGSNTVCYLSQFTNAVYALAADSKNPSSVYIYDATAKSWSTQAVATPSSPGGVAFDPTSFNAILDHDTNVFYALSKGEMFFLDMTDLKAGNSTPLPWSDVGKSPYDPSYQPVMALAQNHIHFIDVPSLTAGQADIFVIHFSFFQPEPQAYPISDGSNFPQQHGQATSFFQTSGVQQEFAYIPDDGSATYVINVETNTTQALSGPATKDAKATYFAGVTSLVQLDSAGNVMFLPYQEGDATANKAAVWTKVSAVPAPAAGTTGGGASSSNAPGASASGTGSRTGAAPQGTGTGSAGQGQGSSSDAPAGRNIVLGFSAALALAVAAVLL